MPLVTTAELVAAAAKRGGGVAAFNVITLEHAEGIVAGAQRAATPVILQVSENTVAFHGTLRPLSAALVALAGRCRGAGEPAPGPRRSARPLGPGRGGRVLVGDGRRRRPAL